jgi:hypothetical protein
MAVQLCLALVATFHGKKDILWDPIDKDQTILFNPTFSKTKLFSDKCTLKHTPNWCMQWVIFFFALEMYFLSQNNISNIL